LTCLLEYIEQNLPGQRLQVFATDIDEHALQRARHGVYPPGIELDVSAERLQRFFSRAEKGYQVSRKVRDIVVFARHNLGKDPPFSRLDLISCRNLLIYLQAALQKRVMRVFHYALNPRGCLLLGSAESIGEAADLFSLLERKLKLYVKKQGVSPGVFEFAFGARHDDGTAAMTGPSGERKPELSMQQLADRKILDKYAPPGVLIDESLNILQFRGHTGTFLAPSPGTATLSIVRMIRPELLVPFKSAVQRVLQEGGPVSSDQVHLSEPAAPLCAVDVIPLEVAAQSRSLLVLFREIPAERPEQARDAAPAEPANKSPLKQGRVQELERELLTTKEYLETIVQELATANEELQASNEELQSSNEELQSTNEELETSKEELQASNEELATMNDELQARIGQLGVSNDDLVNVLIHVTSPVLLVGLDLRIRRMSSAAERLLDLSPSDIGRPISYLGTILNEPTIEAVVSDAIDTVRATEIRVRCANGGRYAMHVAPYQTADRAIRGVVLELSPVAITESAGARIEFDELLHNLLAVLPHEVVLLDQSLHVIWMNRQFQAAWRTSADVLGRPLDLLLPRTRDTERLWSAIEEAVLARRGFDDHVLCWPDSSATPHTLHWSGRPLPAETGRAALTMLTIERSSGATEGCPDGLRKAES
jgi:two-component system CheB/CheR fusion protein